MVPQKEIAKRDRHNLKASDKISGKIRTAVRYHFKFNYSGLVVFVALSKKAIVEGT